jgi:hypothetical protein
VRTVVLTLPPSDTVVGEALARALERLPATVEEAPIASRFERLQQLAEDVATDWIVIVDADVKLVPEAFGALTRAMAYAPAIVGGRAFVGAGQRFGAMFGPARSGPNPFDLVPLHATRADRQFADVVRGAIDVPQRGAYFVSAEFIRSLAGAPLDPVTLHLDLAVYARRAGRVVICEPALTFEADEDSAQLRGALGNVRRFAAITSWKAETLHRDPVGLRSAFVTREVRVMGNIRGYARTPYPPIDALIVAGDELARNRARREGALLAVNGNSTVCAPDDGDAVRKVLARTGDRYVLVAVAGALPSRADVEVLAERLERSARWAVAVQGAAAPYGAALFHAARIVNAGSASGAGAWDVVENAIEGLPQRRMFAVSAAGELLPPMLPPVKTMQRLDVVFVAASKPAATEQTLGALLGESYDGATYAVYAAGAATTERQFKVHPWVQLVPDDFDVQLAAGLNRALGSTTAEGVAIVRDDAQLPHGVLARLMDAFRRLPRLGVAVPRLGGTGRPESLPDLGYRSVAEMQTLYDRRAGAFAREATLMDVATSPVMVVSREVLDLVGGFDETFGFSRCGVEDFTRRVRAANFLVACCEDTYAHLFAPTDAESLVGALDEAPFLRAAYERRWSIPRGFDPATDRVPLRTDAAANAPAGQPPGVRVLLPLRDVAEWSQARAFLVELAAAFRVNDPVRVAIGLDGELGVQEVLGVLRELLLASNVPMEETLTVDIDIVHDVGAWRDAGTNNVRFEFSDRMELAELPQVAGVAAIQLRVKVPTA